ncbi:ATP-binding cassette (ABC) Superfamily, partial [Phytophthora palmivora]
MPPAPNEKSPLLKELNVASLEDPQASQGATAWELRVLLIPYFWPKTWGLRLRVFISFSFMFLSRGSRILAPLFLKEATNTISESQFTRIPIFAIAMYCVTLFGFAAAKQLQTYLYMVVKQHAYQDVAAKVPDSHAEFVLYGSLRADLFGHLHSLSMNYHLTKKTGKVLRCLDRGSTSTDNIVNVIFFRLLPTFVELVVVSIVFIFSFKEKILSIVTIIGVILYVVITAMGTRI